MQQKSMFYVWYIKKNIVFVFCCQKVRHPPNEQTQKMKQIIREVWKYHNANSRRKQELRRT